MTQPAPSHAENPTGLTGIDFVELTSGEPQALHALLVAFGFSRTMRHAQRDVDLYEQHDITFLVNREAGSFAGGFAKAHGPSICSMGWRFTDPTAARATAVARGARPAERVDLLDAEGHALPAIYGIGESLLYFVKAPMGSHDAVARDSARAARWAALGFVPHPSPVRVADKGFLAIDHLTNNVHKGTMQTWASFYKDVFGFSEVRYFDIKGVKTGLASYALRSPDGSFCIPINEGRDQKSQIDEYLEEYGGPGVQHLAFLTQDIVASLRALEGSGIETLDIDDEYYASVFERVPNVTEDHAELQRLRVLVDGDEEGYLLQIFTKNVVGPIFVEVIQRKNHLSFGEGNFGALFRSIERDQQRRGYLEGVAAP